MFLFNLILVTSVTASMHIQAWDTVTVTVFYESLGKKSVDLITKQLYPTYVAVNKGYLSMNTPMKLELVPYGECRGRDTQPDKRETCVFNKLHACALSVSRNENNWTPLNFINCILTAKRNFEAAATCAVRTCFDDRLMASCVNTVDGDRILSRHRNRTLAGDFPLSELPAVTFDGVYDREEQARARTNLLQLVCEKIGNTATEVAACGMPRAKEAMTHDNFGSGMFYPERIHCYFWVNKRHWEHSSMAQYLDNY